MVDYLGRLPGNGINDFWNAHAQCHHFVHDIKDVFHSRIHASAMMISTDDIRPEACFTCGDGL